MNKDLHIQYFSKFHLNVCRNTSIYKRRIVICISLPYDISNFKTKQKKTKKGRNLYMAV